MSPRRLAKQLSSKENLLNKRRDKRSKHWPKRAATPSTLPSPKAFGTADDAARTTTK
ncbi:hypothetical protein CONLIGDRAFT_710573 [Coniochaeta ligniaria NRRL 30616]|uniref:Uncharacterized protein n=1 Tax=Coniochaeta ligniaria NRRL 30616 TaxID=1408157 RepID=A0A1J7JYZ7_9PEZI|nr:hypothetical protein CONLIGDRAFT_710573 [Coniochaeta ligniaria NRRL 30616]